MPKIADPYKTLKVKRGASKDEVKRAYRRRAAETHPDRGGDPEEFKAVARAMQILGDDAKRERYDAGGDGEEKRGLTVAEYLTQVLGTVVAKAVEAGRSVKVTDIVAAMKRAVAGHAADLAKCGAQLVKMTMEMEEVQRRLTTAKANDVLGCACGAHLSDLEAKRKACQHETEVVALAGAELNNYDYRCEKEQQGFATLIGSGAAMQWNR